MGKNSTPTGLPAAPSPLDIPASVKRCREIVNLLTLLDGCRYGSDNARRAGADYVELCTLSDSVLAAGEKVGLDAAPFAEYLHNPCPELSQSAGAFLTTLLAKLQADAGTPRNGGAAGKSRWPKRDTGHGVPLRLVAEILQNSDAERTEAMLKRWNRSHRKKPEPVGRNPSDRRACLYESTAIVDWVRQEEGCLTVPQDKLIRRLVRMAVEPMASAKPTADLPQ